MMSEFRRQHPVAAVTQLLEVLRQNLVPIIIFLFVGTQNAGNYFWWLFGAGLASTFVLGIAGWFRFTFRVHEDELQIKKGIFVRKKLYLSKERIQVIDITEGLIQRMFGLVKVEVKSAGGGTEKATISAISLQDATELRALLREGVKKPGETAAQDVEIAKPGEKVWILGKRQLFYAALTSGNFGLIASILGAISGQLDQFITDENLDKIYNLLPGMSDLSAIVWIVVIIILVSYLFSFIGVVLSYSDFKLRRKENELVITSGLLERKHITVPFNRIQALRFVEGITRQPFGYGMLYVESASFEQKENARSIVLAPFIKKNLLADFFADFIEEINEPETHITPPKRSLIRFIRRPNYLLLLLIPAVWFFWDNAWVLFLLLIPFSLFGWLEYSDAAVSFNKEMMKLEFRTLSKTTAYVRRNRTQVSELTENPFQRHKGLVTAHITVASGAGGRAFSVPDLDADDANRIYRWTITDG
jgi:putative membrane protein